MKLGLAGENSEVGDPVEHIEIAEHRTERGIDQRKAFAAKPWRGRDARFKPRKTLLELGCLGFKCCFVRRRVKTRDIAEYSRSEFDPGAILGAPQGIGRMQLMRLGLLEILQNDRGFENWDLADLQHRRLAERRNRDKPIRFVSEVDIDALEGDALFGQRDHRALHIGTELVAGQF